MQEDRRRGIPRTDVERAANHYGVSLEEAERMLQADPGILPTRGTGLAGIGSPGFISSLTELIKQYPLQTAVVGVAVVALLVNIKATKSIVNALQFKGSKK